MRYYLYILFIFIFSCEEIQENSEALPYGFLISEGWINFENGDLDSAEELFLDVLDFEEEMLPYYSAAYLGLGWIKLYQAKTLSGDPSDNFNYSHDLRIEARDYFNLILDECDDEDQIGECSELSIPNEIIFDAYAGLAYSNSLMAMYEDFYYGDEEYSCSLNNQRFSTLIECESSCVQYLCDIELNEQNYDNLNDCEYECSGGTCNLADLCSNISLSFTESALEYSDILLNNNPDYYFVYDSDIINANSIHLLRAQLYIDINDYDQAQEEISLVNFPSSSITFTLEDFEGNPNSSYDRYIYIGFEGYNNSKHYMPMETDLYYDCYFSCENFTNEMSCIDGCEWVENTEEEEVSSICQGEYNEEILIPVSEDCGVDCLEGECEFLYFKSHTTNTFTPMLPCLDLIIDEVDLDDQEVVQCLESFPTNTLEYRFAIRFPSSIFYGYECETGLLDLYPTLDICNSNCSDGECVLVDIDEVNCDSAPEYIDAEYIDGIGCIDGYMYLMEEFEDDCLEDEYRLIEIQESESSISLSSSFGLCSSN